MEKVGQIYLRKSTDVLYRIEVVNENTFWFIYKGKEDELWSIFLQQNIVFLGAFENNKDFELIENIKENIQQIYVSRLSKIE